MGVVFSQIAQILELGGEVTVNPAGPVSEQFEEGLLEPVSKKDWGLAIEAVMKSLSIRRSKIPGSREYLDFVKDFIGQAKARANSRL
jgi:hypothetical protein